MRWPLVQAVEHVLHGRCGSLEHGLDRAVVEVAHRSREAVLACVTKHESTEADHLHPAVHDRADMQGFEGIHRGPTICGDLSSLADGQATATACCAAGVSLRTSGGISRKDLISTPLNSDISARMRRCTGASWSRPGRYQLSIRDTYSGSSSRLTTDGSVIVVGGFGASFVPPIIQSDIFRMSGRTSGLF